MEGLTEYIVNNVTDCFMLLQRGESNRITRETKANISSSRSHSVFQILLEQEEPDGKLTRSKLNLCDLAGSEKIYSEDRLGEKHLEEHNSINLSLSTLGKVVQALAKGKAGGLIPFRESKLTKLLKDSLGGDTNTILLATINPLASSIDETISTLKFADRASKIKVRAKKNQFDAKEDVLIKRLRREVNYLKDILQMRKNMTKQDMNQEMLNLKEENFKLRELAEKGQHVERLMEENQQLKEKMRSD